MALHPCWERGGDGGGGAARASKQPTQGRRALAGDGRVVSIDQTHGLLLCFAE